MQKSWKICQFCRFFQFFSHLLFPQHLGTHFFGFLTIFYMDIGLFYWIFIMKIACIKTNMSKKRSKRATTLAEVKKSIFFKKRPKSDLVFTWYSLFEVSRVTWWWKWWRFLTFDPTAILALGQLNCSKIFFQKCKCNKLWKYSNFLKYSYKIYHYYWNWVTFM